MTRVRVGLLSAAALGAALLLSGCGSGQLSQTARIQPAVPGANSTPGPGADNSIQLRNVMFPYPGVEGYRQGGNAPLQLHIFNIGQKPVRLVQVETDAASAVTLQGGPVASGTSSPSPGATAAHPQNPPAVSNAPSESALPETPSVSASETPSAAPSGSPAETPSAAASAAPGGGPVSVAVPVNGFVTLSPATGGTLQLEGLTRAIRSGQSVSIRFVFDNGAEYTLDVPVDVPTTPAPKGSAATGVIGGANGGE